MHHSAFNVEITGVSVKIQSPGFAVHVASSNNEYFSQPIVRLIILYLLLGAW